MSSDPAPIPHGHDAANILLVDDQPARLLTYRAILEPLGHNLVAVNSGLEALEALMKQEFAVVLLDVKMPGMDGFETAALIWFGVSVGLLFLIAALLAEILHDTLHHRFRVTFGRLTAVVFVFLLCWPPALYNLEKGQWSILLTALVCLGWLTWKHRKFSKIFAAGVLLLIASQPFRVVASSSAVWLEFTAWLASLQ